MADAKSRVTIFLEAFGGTVPTGWTETFYSNSEDLDLLIELWKNRYCGKRAELLGKGARISYLRVSTISAPRRSRTISLFGKDSESYSNQSRGDSYDPVQVDLLIRMTTALGKRRQFWLAGLPDKYTDQLIKDGMEANLIYGPVYKQYFQAIRDLEALIRYKSSPPVLTPFDSATIVHADPIMIRNRKRGRPFKLFRGRRAV